MQLYGAGNAYLTMPTRGETDDRVLQIWLQVRFGLSRTRRVQHDTSCVQEVAADATLIPRSLEMCEVHSNG